MSVKTPQIQNLRRFFMSGEEWAEAGLTLPKLVYWNVCARNNIILDGGDDVSFVSGASPVLFEQICKGVTGWELCLEKLMSERYSNIK